MHGGDVTSLANAIGNWASVGLPSEGQDNKADDGGYNLHRE